MRSWQSKTHVLRSTPARALHPSLLRSPEKLTLGHFGILGLARWPGQLSDPGRYTAPSAASRRRRAQHCGRLGSLAHLPPPGPRLPTTVSADRFRTPPRLPRPGRSCSGDKALTPAASSRPRVGARRLGASLKASEGGRPLLPVHRPFHGSLPPSSPAHHPRSAGASSSQSSSGRARRLRRKCRQPVAPPRWAPPGHAAPDLEKKASCAQRTQALTAGLGLKGLGS